MCYSDSSSYAELAISSLALEALIDRYLRDLADAGIPDPLGQVFTLATMLHDLSVLAEIPSSAEILAHLGD